MRRSFPACISVSLMVVYSAGFGVVQKFKRRHIKANLPTILIHVDVVFVFAWMPRYEASSSIFLIRICLEGHLRRMAAII